MNDDDVSKATSRLDDFQFIYTKRGPPIESVLLRSSVFSFLHLVSLVTGLALVHAADSVSASMGSWADAGEETEGSSLLDSSSCFTSPPGEKINLVNFMPPTKKEMHLHSMQTSYNYT